jgi:amino acid transporter
MPWDLEQNGSFIRDTRAVVNADGQRRRFPGWGEIFVYGEANLAQPDRSEERPHVLLGELYSTALCGNDITGSCFYVIGSLASAAGIWAPLCALFASATLWLYRWVYTEAVTALPFNGGIYNILLNCSRSKRIASFVATLTILSYIATAVVSATSAANYAVSLFAPGSCDDRTADGCYVIPIAVSLIVLFAVLKLIGMSESAVVAAGIFTFHLVTMSVLACASVLFLFTHGDAMAVLQDNFHYTIDSGDHVGKLLQGLSAAMLGVSGFESSANFVEEQAEGVFPKTLRNMWVAVSFLNVGFVSLALGCIRLVVLVDNRKNALAFLASQVGGRWLQVWVTIDAGIILAAAILTSYVGVSGLCARMGGDRCLPQICARNGSITTLSFMTVCIAFVLATQGSTVKLEACYSFAFLAVMALFALSVFVLQTQRPMLPRAMTNNPLIPFLAATLVFTALYGAILSHFEVVPVFLSFWMTLAFIVLIFGARLKLLKACEKLLGLPLCVPRIAASISGLVSRVQHESSVVYFTKSGNLCRLNKALLYVKRNEDTNHCRIVHIWEDPSSVPRHLVHIGQLLDAMYPSVRVDTVFVKGKFGPVLID